MAITKKKEFVAKRKFRLRQDSSVGAGQKEIEKVFGLPEGSVKIHMPNGRKARSDKSVEALLADWKHVR